MNSSQPKIVPSYFIGKVLDTRQHSYTSTTASVGNDAFGKPTVSVNTEHHLDSYSWFYDLESNKEVQHSTSGSLPARVGHDIGIAKYGKTEFVTYNFSTGTYYYTEGIRNCTLTALVFTIMMLFFGWFMIPVMTGIALIQHFFNYGPGIFGQNLFLPRTLKPQFLALGASGFVTLLTYKILIDSILNGNGWGFLIYLILSLVITTKIVSYYLRKTQEYYEIYLVNFKEQLLERYNTVLENRKVGS